MTAAEVVRIHADQTDAIPVVVAAPELPPMYVSPAQIAVLYPGLTVKKLEHLRSAGAGPDYFKPTDRTVLYLAEDIAEWVAESRVRTRH